MTDPVGHHDLCTHTPKGDLAHLQTHTEYVSLASTSVCVGSCAASLGPAELWTFESRPPGIHSKFGINPKHTDQLGHFCRLLQKHQDAAARSALYLFAAVERAYGMGASYRSRTRQQTRALIGRSAGRRDDASARACDGEAADGKRPAAGGALYPPRVGTARRRSVVVYDRRAGTPHTTTRCAGSRGDLSAVLRTGGRRFCNCVPAGLPQRSQSQIGRGSGRANLRFHGMSL